MTRMTGEQAPPATRPRAMIPGVVRRHLQAVETLIDMRARDVVARRGTLGVLGDYDECLSAHLDGVVAGGARAQ